MLRKPMKIVTITHVVIQLKFQIGVPVIHDSNVILWYLSSILCLIKQNNTKSGTSEYMILDHHSLLSKNTHSEMI